MDSSSEDTKYTLKKFTWVLGDKIADPSGFATVYEATNNENFRGVLKLIPKEPGASRELLFGNLKGLPNIIPIIDIGESETHFFIAMPRAKRSLRQFLNDKSHGLPLSEILIIANDILEALVAVESKVVHRDLKPANILFYQDKWCLADFGIARYADASTSQNTRKMAMSLKYDAPERWRFERASSSTDIYSFGIILWELVAGHAPFIYSTWEDYREAHLNLLLPELDYIPASLSSIIQECTYKPMGARPRPSNIVARLNKISGSQTSASLALQAINKELVSQKAVKLEEETTKIEREKIRSELFKTASLIFRKISLKLGNSILDNAPESGNGVKEIVGSRWSLNLGEASIVVSSPIQTKQDSFGRFKPPFNVIAHCKIEINIPKRQDFEGRSHSLWFGDLQHQGEFRWFECGFMYNPFIPKRFTKVPTAFDPGEASGKAFSNSMAEWALAMGVNPIDQGEENGFIERWMCWFAQAAQNKLYATNKLPETRPEGTYRLD